MKFSDKSLHVYGMFLLIINLIITLLIGIGGYTLIDKYIHKNIIIVYSVIIGVLGLYFSKERNVYLPFLDETVLPCSLLKKISTPSNPTVTKKVTVPPNSTVIYWASEPSTSDTLTTPDIAYGNYKNSGVTKATSDGTAILKVRDPQGYKVPRLFRTKILTPHIHYRYCKDTGFISEIKTVKL